MSAPAPAPPPPPVRFWPWRSAAAGWAVAAAALIAGVPLFLRMPPWCDATLYDVAARNLLAGGVHYRDVFDTNLPGFVWILTAIRAAFGWGVEPLRAVDLLVVAGVVLLLDRLAARAGATPAARAWAVAAAAVFYPFLSEFNHCQRDVWMLLPAAAAVWLRVRRLSALPISTARGVVRPIAEGALWGLAVWIKPHVVVPAAAVWLLTVPRMLAVGGWRAMLADLAGNLAGGLAVGVAGIAYLILSGTWPYFVEVFTFWNAGYASVMWAELPYRYGLQFHYFHPWSYLQLFSLPVAVLCVLDARSGTGPGPVGRVLPDWLWDPGSGEAVRFARLAIAALYLGWTAQAFFLQRGFHYVHVPETLMLLFVLASQRWVVGFVMLVWLAITGAVVLSGAAEPANATGVGPPRGPDWAVLHPAADPVRMMRWADCWRTSLPPPAYRERMNAVGLIHNFHAANDWEQLGEAADWLRAHGVRDGELLCWDDAPHALYLKLSVRPAFRFMHVGQMTGIGPEHEDRVRAELCAAPRPRWVVSDLMRLESEIPELLGRLADAGPDLLPRALPADLRCEFPFDQPAVFRSGDGRGRYIIFELRRPIPWCP
jgi:hypothetical protein